MTGHDRSTRVRLGAVALVAVVACASTACSNDDSEAAVSQSTIVSSVPADTGTEDQGADEVPTSQPEASAASVAGQGSFGEELPSALGLPEIDERPAPVAVSIPSLGLDGVVIEPVGVEANGVMEVPAADRVGWYRYGPSPGETGSAVLAGHVASPAGDGAFRRLSELSAGDLVQVVVDGRERSFRVSTVELIDKTDVPFDEVFARDGDPTLVLVTCGGDWDAARRSYVGNVVVTAVPASS